IFKRKTAYEIETWLEFRRVLFRSEDTAEPGASRDAPGPMPGPGASRDAPGSAVSSVHARVEQDLGVAVLALVETGIGVRCLGQQIGRATGGERCEKAGE